MSERLSVQVNEHQEPVAMSFDPGSFSRPALFEIAEHQLKTDEEREMVLYHRNEPVVHIHTDHMKNLKELFRKSDQPEALIDELTNRMGKAKLILIRTISF